MTEVLDAAWVTGFALIGYAGFGTVGAGFGLILSAVMLAAAVSMEVEG